MIKAMICCGGGFSSSTMANYIAEGIKNNHMEDQISIEFCPFTLSAKKYPEYDIIVCCPHLDRQVKEHNRRYIQDAIPMYVLPPRMYGPVDIKDLYEDIQDILAGFEKNPKNPFVFPGEENILKVRRLHSYRSTHPEWDPKA